MSEPLDRARRVVAVGAAALVVVIVALAAAAWRLVETETADAALRARSAAALAVEDLVRALAGDSDVRTGSRFDVSQSTGEIRLPEGSYPPRPFDPMPPLADREAAFYLRESESLSAPLRRAALLRAVRSSDPATRIASAAAGARLEIREGVAQAEAVRWADLAGDLGSLSRTRDGVLLTLMRPARSHFADYAEVDPSILDVVGSNDDADVRSMIAALVPHSEAGVRSRRRALAEIDELRQAFRESLDVEGRYRASLLPDGDAFSAVRDGDWWRFHRPRRDVVDDIVGRVLAPRGMRLVRADAATMPAAVAFPGDGAWSVAATFAEDESRSRSTLLLAALGVAATAAVLAFAAFARSVRREARIAMLRTEFVATVSHELRTPVAIVRTSAETLAAGRAGRPEDRQALTEAIVRESERLSSLVGNVLDFARMEAGRRAYASRATDVGALVRDVAERHAGVAVDVADGLAPLPCDSDALAAAVGNLLDNARKFSPPGAPVTVRVRGGADAVVVEVEDRGIGVPDGEKRRVFERFFRGADPRVRETRGAGIGLALVDHAVRAHGGRVEVADTPGGGATFRIVLPREQNGAA